MELVVWNGNLVLLLMATVFVTAVGSYLRCYRSDLVSGNAGLFAKLGAVVLREGSCACTMPPGPGLRLKPGFPFFRQQASSLL